MHGRIALLIVAAVAATACGRGASVPEADATASSNRSVVPAAPATVAVDADIEPAPLPDTVAVFEADLLVSGVTALETGVVNAIDGVQFSAPLALIPVTARDQQIDVAVIDPDTFRPLTPEETADEPAVWERIRAGDAVLTHATGSELDALLGSNLALVGEHASQAVRVGAYASNGIPPVADVIVNWAVGADPRGQRAGSPAGCRR